MSNLFDPFIGGDQVNNQISAVNQSGTNATGEQVKSVLSSFADLFSVVNKKGPAPSSTEQAKQVEGDVMSKLAGATAEELRLRQELGFPENTRREDESVVQFVARSDVTQRNRDVTNKIRILDAAAANPSAASDILGSLTKFNDFVKQPESQAEVAAKAAYQKILEKGVSALPNGTPMQQTSVGLQMIQNEFNAGLRKQQVELDKSNLDLSNAQKEQSKQLLGDSAVSGALFEFSVPVTQALKELSEISDPGARLEKAKNIEIDMQTKALDITSRVGIAYPETLASVTTALNGQIQLIKGVINDPSGLKALQDAMASREAKASLTVPQEVLNTAAKLSKVDQSFRQAAAQNMILSNDVDTKKFFLDITKMVGDAGIRSMSAMTSPNPKSTLDAIGLTARTVVGSNPESTAPVANILVTYSNQLKDLSKNSDKQLSVINQMFDNGLEQGVLKIIRTSTEPSKEEDLLLIRENLTDALRNIIASNDGKFVYNNGTNSISTDPSKFGFFDTRGDMAKRVKVLNDTLRVITLIGTKDNANE